MKPAKSKPKTNQVREFGDAWYVPLTKQLRLIAVPVGGYVDITVEGGKIIITKSSRIRVTE